MNTKDRKVKKKRYSKTCTLDVGSWYVETMKNPKIQLTDMEMYPTFLVK